MKTSLTTKGILSLVLLLLVVSSGNAQKFTNKDAGTYSAGANGKIVMKGTTTTSVFDGNKALGSNENPSNTTSNTDGRIPGLVEWNNSGNQTIQARYYTNLSTANIGTKTISNGVYVSGTYTPVNGDRVYQGTFYYDGIANQTIAAEGNLTGTNNAYNNLYLKAYDAATANNKTNTGGVRVLGNFTSTAQGNLIAQNDFQIEGAASVATGNITIDPTANAVTFKTIGTGTFELDGDLTYTNYTTNVGNLNLTSTGDFTIDAGSLTLENSANTTLEMSANSKLVVTGGFTNAFAARTNMEFDGTSTVTYNAAGQQTMVSTASTAANKYGNLITTGAEKLLDATGTNVAYVATSLAVNGNSYINLQPTLASLGNGAGQNPMNGKIVDVEAGVNNLTFAGDLATNYITGQVRRSGTLNTTNDYTFNNASTKLNFATTPTDFSVFVVPGDLPNTYAANVNGSFDVARTVVYGYTGTAPEVDGVVNGYLSSEASGISNYNVNFIKYGEAYAYNQDKEKWAAGALGRTVTGGVVELASTYSPTLTKSTFEGTHASANTEMFANNSALVFTTKSAIYSIADGRWSRPETWDDNVMPSPNDSAVVRHFVYTGVDIANGTYGTSGYDVNERNGIDNNDETLASAYNITIIAPTATFTHPALVIGHKDVDLSANQVFRTRLVADTDYPFPGIFNYNATPNTGDPNVTSYSPATNLVHGLYTTEISGATGTAIIGASQITNTGTITNKGTIEVGK